MNIKAKNNINVHDKPKVFFVSHPNDFDKYFETIANDILSTNNCAIYYYDNELVSQESDWKSDLFEINLIVIPITHDFLFEHCLAFDIYTYAQNESIPVLPIMVEPGLEKIFNSVCGEKQFLDKTDNDPTSIPYSKKLSDYLSVVLIGDELAKKVREAFDAYVFLSYRKKDRKHAQKLMKAIHQNEFARDIAIWYDEFLQPNENFNDAIREALLKSDLFALAVTPNLINEENYVVSEEYPAAVTAKKQILPVELVYTDQKLLNKKFEGLPNCVSINDLETLTEQLIKSLSHIAKQTHSNEPEHNYYIGLAYLHGIDVEIDKNKAVDLITYAAKNGVIDATNELVKMYYYGFYVEKNIPQAIFWQKNLVLLLDEKCKGESSTSLQLDLADALRFLTEVERNGLTDKSNINEMISYCRRAINICDRINLSDEKEKSRLIECKLNTLRSLAILYELSEKFDEALAVYFTSLEMRKEIIVLDKEVGNQELDVANTWRLAQLYHDIGIVYRKMDEYELALSEMLKSIELYTEIRKVTPDYLSNESAVHEALSYVAAFVDPDLAEKHSLLAVDICEKLVKENAELYELNYANSLLNRASVLSELNSSDFSEQQELCLEAEKIYEKNIDSGSYEIIFDYVNVLSKLAAVNRKQIHLDKAKRYYEKAIVSLSKIIDFSASEDKLVFAHLFFDYGTLLAIDGNNNQLCKALKNLYKALDLYKSIGNQRFIDEISSVIIAVENALEKNDNADKPYTANANESIKTAYFSFQHFREEGVTDENDKDYKTALLKYQSALEQLSVLEKDSDSFDVLEKADILDRMAYCCEMLKEPTDAEQYYIQATEIALTETRKTLNDIAIETSILFLKKIITFYIDYGKEKEADMYISKAEELKSFLSAVKEQRNSSVISDDNVFDILDENGERLTVRLLDIIDFNHKQFAILAPEANSIISKDSVIIWQVKRTLNGGINHKVVTKHALFEQIYYEFKKQSLERFSFGD